MAKATAKERAEAITLLGALRLTNFILGAAQAGDAPAAVHLARELKRGKDLTSCCAQLHCRCSRYRHVRS